MRGNVLWLIHEVFEHWDEITLLRQEGDLRVKANLF